MIRRMNRKFSFILLICTVVGLGFANLLVVNDLQDISKTWPRPPARPTEDLRSPLGPTVRIGVVSRFAPNIIYAGYQPIMDYLNRHGTYRYELRLSTGYQDAVDRLQDGEVTASFLGAWITSRLDPEGPLFPLVAPMNAQGRSEFHTVLVTRPGQPISRLEDLNRRRVALPSALSWSGNWLEAEGLPRAGLAVTDLDSIHHFAHHQTVVWQVLRGHFDAGIVKESVADRYLSEGLVPVLRSEPYPGPPLVASRNAPAEVVSELTRLLLALNPRDPGDREILSGWTPEFSHGFTPVDMDLYQRAFPPGGKAP
jgi:phosphonate transport system substrate-binding protein